MQCALPNDPTTIALNKSLLAGVSTAVGEDVGGAVGSVSSGVASGLGGSLLENTSIPGLLLLTGLIVGGIFLMRR